MSCFAAVKIKKKEDIPLLINLLQVYFNTEIAKDIRYKKVYDKSKSDLSIDICTGEDLGWLNDHIYNHKDSLIGINFTMWDDFKYIIVKSIIIKLALIAGETKEINGENLHWFNFDNEEDIYIVPLELKEKFLEFEKDNPELKLEFTYLEDEDYSGFYLNKHNVESAIKHNKFYGWFTKLFAKKLVEKEQEINNLAQEKIKKIKYRIE